MRDTSAKRTHASGSATDNESPAAAVLTMTAPTNTATPVGTQRRLRKRIRHAAAMALAGQMRAIPLPERVSTTAPSAARKYATPTAPSPMKARPSQRDARSRPNVRSMAGRTGCPGLDDVFSGCGTPIGWPLR